MAVNTFSTGLVFLAFFHKSLHLSALWKKTTTAKQNNNKWFETNIHA